MKLLPSVLHWSYHRQFAGSWRENIDTYLTKVSSLAKKYNFNEMGINLDISRARNSLPGNDKNTVIETSKRFEEYGLFPIPVMSPVEIHADKEIVNASLEKLKRELERAEWLGASTSQFSTNVHGRLTREKAVRILTECMTKLGEYALDCGQNICTEDYFTFTSDELIKAVENCGKENVGYLNDIGNWMILGEDPVAVTKKLAHRTVHVHLKDYILADGIWTSVPFGQGFIKLKEALEILDKTPLDKTVYMAFETDIDEGDEDEAMEICFQYMRDWYNTK